MQAQLLNAFFDAALEGLSSEIKSAVQRDGLDVDQNEHIQDEFVVYAALVGDLRGMVMLGMTKRTARFLASEMVGDHEQDLNELKLSALAELGNIVAGRATMKLEKLGFSCDITPPTIMMGSRSRLSTLGLPRFVIPLATVYGLVRLHVAAYAI